MTLPAELKPKQVTAVIDTREQLPLDLAPLQAVDGTLATGDYSIRGLEHVVAIERKSLPDLLGCVGQHRERFDREVIRLLAYPVRALVVETPGPGGTCLGCCTSLPVAAGVSRGHWSKQWGSTMPRKPKRPCPRAGCPGLWDGETCTRCGTRHRSEQQRLYDRERRDPAATAFYHSERWRKWRKWFVSRHPLCVECRKLGRVNPTENVHHIEPVAERPDLAFDEDNCLPLCVPHHNQVEPRQAARAEG